MLEARGGGGGGRDGEEGTVFLSPALFSIPSTELLSSPVNSHPRVPWARAVLSDPRSCLRGGHAAEPFQACIGFFYSIVSGWRVTTIPIDSFSISGGGSGEGSQEGSYGESWGVCGTRGDGVPPALGGTCVRVPRERGGGGNTVTGRGEGNTKQFKFPRRRARQWRSDVPRCLPSPQRAMV